VFLAIDSIAILLCDGAVLRARVYKTAVIPRKPGGWRLAVLTLALITFALQSYITQTHVHFASREAFGLSADNFVPTAKTATGKTAPSKQTPSNDDPANCPLCQAAAHSGQFVTPVAIGFALPSEAIAIVPLAIVVLTASKTVSHSWQGRAPPRI
jgi:hypothetical protein